jgi:hypothetical protein
VLSRLAATLAALACAVGLTAPSVAVPVHPHRDATTTITLKVVGCDGCKIQAVQNVEGDLPYRSRFKHVHDRRVEFVVPTERTQQMAFIVFAPFDEVSDAGFPMVVMVGWKDKDPGGGVSASYAAGVHKGSGCWAGTTDAVVKNRLVVTRVHVREPVLGPGTFTAAAGHLTTALPALPFFAQRHASELHVSDPSICK